MAWVVSSSAVVTNFGLRAAKGRFVVRFPQVHGGCPLGTIETLKKPRENAAGDRSELQAFAFPPR